MSFFLYSTSEGVYVPVIFLRPCMYFRELRFLGVRFRESVRLKKHLLKNVAV